MSKRFEPLKEFGRSTKKPRLDITISKVRPEQRQSSSKDTGSTGSTVLQPSKNCLKPAAGLSNLWDDDDDDVILLATQVAETQAAAANNGLAGVSFLQQQSEITFSEFAPHLHASTSTQRLAVPPAAISEPTGSGMCDMFNEDDDEAFAMLICEDPMSKAEKQKQKNEAPPEPFKRQIATNFRSDIVERKKASPSSPTMEVELPNSQSAARRQLASERQIQFLMERVDSLKKENQKLNNVLLETKTKMESKEGESSLLRDELRHKKQQIQKLKMERIFSTESTKSECKTTIAELSKQVEAIQTELQLKSVECSMLKMKHADETKRLEVSMRTQLQQPPELPPSTLATTKRRLRGLKCLRGLMLNNDAYCIHQPLEPIIFENSYDDGTNKKRRTIFQLELEKLQAILAQLQLKDSRTFPSGKQEQLGSEIISSVCKVFSEFWTYVHSLEFFKNCRIYPYHTYHIIHDHSESQRQSLHQMQQLHPEERAVSLRRYVSCLSVACSLLPRLSLSLLEYQHGEYMLLQIAIDAINKLGFSREICEHFGLLEAFATLLHTILLQRVDLVEGKSTLLIAFLKSLIFCRPSPWIFRVISFCVLECVRFPSDTLSTFCINSESQTFITDRMQSVYRFSVDSCLLQVYAGLLEVAFPLYTPLRLTHFKLLAVICEQHVRFIHHCFEDPPKFIRDHLPNYEDDDEEDDDDTNFLEQQQPMQDKRNSVLTVTTTSTVGHAVISTSVSNMNSSKDIRDARQNITSTHQQCECYNKLCLSLITLLYQLLRQWEFQDRKSENLRVQQISKISVKLLHTIFCDNYITRLFREAEETTKHHLYFICKWWSDSSELLNFSEIDIGFLNKLQKSHVMPKKLCEDQSRANIDIDLAKWYRNDKGYPETVTGENKRYNNLRLIEDAVDEEKFMEGLKGYSFNFE